MIKVPKRFSYIEIYLTLKCNFSCSYCINSHTGVKRSRPELSAREWILGINNIDTNGLPLTFGGGEPTFHHDFYEIIEGINRTMTIDLLTNGSYFDVNELMRKIPADRFTRKGDEYKAIRISYHPNHSDPDKIASVASILQNNGYPVGIFGLNHPDNLSRNVVMAERCRKVGVYFFIRDFLGYYNDRLFGYYKDHSALNGNRKKCLCRSEELLVGPDGKIYRCHRDLYDGSAEIGSILNISYELKDEFRPCGNLGLCSPCDAKLKLSSDLKFGKCSIEIKQDE
jgi:hypothetical protein